jgi:hypothetical protein
MGGEFMILLSNYLTSCSPELWPHVLIFSHSREFRAIGVSIPVILAFFSILQLPVLFIHVRTSGFEAQYAAPRGYTTASACSVHGNLESLTR